MRYEIMEIKSRLFAFGIFTILIVVILSSQAFCGEWYNGLWDSSIYNRSEKPRTVGVRVEIRDVETGIAVSGAKVQLKSNWLEERIGTAGDEIGIPYEPQEREFEMMAVSGRDGVVVFALTWGKEYPWKFGRPEPKVDKRGNVTFYDVHSSWKRAVDDIEKIQEIEIRHPNYKFVRIPFNFSHLTEFGQNRRSESQEPRLFEEFENAWHREMKKPGVKFCVLNIGKDFDDFGNKRCTRPQFFEKIGHKDFGTVYREPANWFSVGEHPQSECGPYFVYLLQIDLERRSGQIDVNIRPRQETEQGERGLDKQLEPDSSNRLDDNYRDRQRTRAESDLEAERRREIEKQDTRLRSIAKKHPMGIAGATLSSASRKEMGLFVGVKGVIVKYVQPSSPAEKAGLRAGMVIESIAHRVVSNISDLDAKLEGKKSGDQFLIGVWRKKGSTWKRDTFNLTIP